MGKTFERIVRENLAASVFFISLTFCWLCDGSSSLGVPTSPPVNVPSYGGGTLDAPSSYISAFGPTAPSPIISSTCIVTAALGAIPSTASTKNKTSLLETLNCSMFAAEMNQVLQPSSAFSCTSDWSAAVTSASYMEATSLYSLFQTKAVESLLVNQLGGQCGDYAWIQISGCTSDTVFIWNHVNVPALRCSGRCLVSISLSNGTGVGYNSASTCKKYANDVTSVLQPSSSFSCYPNEEALLSQLSPSSAAMTAVSSMDLQSTQQLLTSLPSYSDSMTTLIASFNYDCRAAAAEVLVTTMDPDTPCPTAPMLTFYQGPCDPCTSALPPPLTRDPTHANYGAYGVICVSDLYDTTGATVQYLASLSIAALSFGDSEVDVIKDFSTWSSAGCCPINTADGHLPSPFPPTGMPLPPSSSPHPPPNPGNLTNHSRHPPLPVPPLPSPLSAAASSATTGTANPYCLNNYWFLQTFKISETNVLEVIGGASFATLTSGGSFHLNVTAAQGPVLVGDALSGSINLQSDGGCNSGGTVHMAGMSESILRLSFPLGGVWPGPLEPPPFMPIFLPPPPTMPPLPPPTPYSPYFPILPPSHPTAPDFPPSAPPGQPPFNPVAHLSSFPPPPPTPPYTPVPPLIPSRPQKSPKAVSPKPVGIPQTPPINPPEGPPVGPPLGPPQAPPLGPPVGPPLAPPQAPPLGPPVGPLHIPPLEQVPSAPPVLPPSTPPILPPPEDIPGPFFPPFTPFTPVPPSIPESPLSPPLASPLSPPLSPPGEDTSPLPAPAEPSSPPTPSLTPLPQSPSPLNTLPHHPLKSSPPPHDQFLPPPSPPPAPAPPSPPASVSVIVSLSHDIPLIVGLSLGFIILMLAALITCLLVRYSTRMKKEKEDALKAAAVAANMRMNSGLFLSPGNSCSSLQENGSAGLEGKLVPVPEEAEIQGEGTMTGPSSDGSRSAASIIVAGFKRMGSRPLSPASVSIHVEDPELGFSGRELAFTTGRAGFLAMTSNAERSASAASDLAGWPSSSGPSPSSSAAGLLPAQRWMQSSSATTGKGAQPWQPHILPSSSNTTLQPSLNPTFAWGLGMTTPYRAEDSRRSKPHRQHSISTETMLLERTPSQSTPYVAAQDHKAACDGAMAGLSDLSLFNAYAQLAHAIIQVDEQSGTADPYDSSQSSSHGRPAGQLGHEIRSGVDLDLQFEDLEFVQQDGGGALLGVGAVGSVYQASFRCQPVAVKVITRAIVDGQFVGHSDSQQDTRAQGDYESLAHEIQILSRLNHPNVVRCLGGCLRPPRVFVVQELMTGTLSGLLRQKLPLLKTLRILLDVASGLQYLHSLSVVHRDLKPANILLDASQTAKISDFGLARCKFKTYLDTRIDAGTVAYMAPEAFDPEIGGLSTAIDIFSLAVVMWEMVSNSTPWESLTNVAIIYQVAVLKARNPIPSDPTICPPKLHSLISRCWVTEPRLRPSCTEVVSELRSIFEEHEALAGVHGEQQMSLAAAAVTSSGSLPHHHPLSIAEMSVSGCSRAFKGVAATSTDYILERHSSSQDEASRLLVAGRECKTSHPEGLHDTAHHGTAVAACSDDNNISSLTAILATGARSVGSGSEQTACFSMCGTDDIANSMAVDDQALLAAASSDHVPGDNAATAMGPVSPTAAARDDCNTSHRSLGTAKSAGMQQAPLHHHHYSTRSTSRTSTLTAPATTTAHLHNGSNTNKEIQPMVDNCCHYNEAYTVNIPPITSMSSAAGLIVMGNSSLVHPTSGEASSTPSTLPGVSYFSCSDSYKGPLEATDDALNANNSRRRRVVESNPKPNYVRLGAPSGAAH